MKMYYVITECIEPMKKLPQAHQNTRVTLITESNENGNHEYKLNHTNKEYLIKTAEFFGFQDAREYVYAINHNENG